LSSPEEESEQIGKTNQVRTEGNWITEQDLN
jgi:hypothetical protein